MVDFLCEVIQKIKVRHFWDTW